MVTRKIGVWLTAAFLLTAVSAHAAVEITSATAQQGQIEGDTVEVTAAVNWGGLTVVNPLIRITRTVQATITPAPVATPAIPTQITLTFDSATSRYRGQFSNLPFNRYTATVTATQTTKNLMEFPATTSTVNDTASIAFNIGAPVGCFNFNQGNSLQGWTVNGPFDGDTTNNLAAEGLVTFWQSSAGFLSPSSTDNDGAIVQLVPASLFPSNATLFSSGFYRLDFSSPSLSTNTAWQGIKGVSFRMSHNLAGIQVQPIVQTRRPDGSTAFFRPVDASGAPIFQTVSSQGYPVVISNLSIPADHTVVGVKLRVFGPAGSVFSQEQFIFMDGVCPRK